MNKLIDAIRSENIKLLKELLEDDEWRSKIRDRLEYFEMVVLTCNIELLQAVLLEILPENHWPINLTHCFELDPLLNISNNARTNDETKKLEMIQFLIPYAYSKDPKRPDFYLLKDFFPGLVAHCSDGNFLVTDFLIHKLYSENNSLYPLIMRLEAAVEKSHYICIFLHDDIDSVMDCFEYIERFEFPYSFLTHFGISVEILTKLLAKESPESMEIAVETFHVLLDKYLIEFAEHWINYTFRSRYESEHEKMNIEVPLLPMFQFLFNSINSKTQEKIYYIISKWLECTPTIIRFLKIFHQSKEFLRPFISKPLNQNLPRRTRRNLVPKYDRKVPSLKEVCRDVIRSKIFEQTNDVKEFMKRIWTLQLPLTVKCFLLYIPDPAWMNNLQI